VELPRGFCNFAKLRVLDLSSNKIKALPKNIGLLNLLVELYASFNQIEELPPDIGRLENCTNIYLSNNCIKRLPEELGNCKSLQMIDVASNRIHIINPLAVKQLTLNDIKLSANPYLHESITGAARNGMENLIDYLHSPEYQELWDDVGDRHPEEEEDQEDKKKKKKEKKKSEKKNKGDDNDEDDGGDDDGGDED